MSDDHQRCRKCSVNNHFTLCQWYTWLIAVDDDDIIVWKFGLMVFIEGKMYKKYTDTLEKSITVTLQRWGTKWQWLWEVPWPRHDELVCLRFKQQAGRPTPFFHWNVRWRNKSRHCLALPLMDSVGCLSVLLPAGDIRWHTVTVTMCHQRSSCQDTLSLLKYILIAGKKMSAVIFNLQAGSVLNCNSADGDSDRTRF